MRSRGDDRGLLIRGDPVTLPPTATKLPWDAAPGKHARLPSKLSQPPQCVADITIATNDAISLTANQRIQCIAVSWGNTQAVARTNCQAVWRWILAKTHFTTRLQTHEVDLWLNQPSLVA